MSSAGLLSENRRRLAVSPSAFRAVAAWALWALVAIVITGALVRLTGSGLGCSDWPNCEPGEFVPAADFHSWVEFGNRLVTGVVSLAVIAAVCASLWRRPRRADLIWLSLGLVAGVLFQIGLGAVTVMTHLSPPIVMSHFLASQVLVAAAVVLSVRAALDPSDPPTAPDQPRPARLARGLRTHGWLIGLLTAAALFTGTVVTGTGPHGGDESVERLGYALPSVARVHGLTVVALIATVLAFALRVRRHERAADAAGPDAMHASALGRPVRSVIGVMAAQAAIGYVQYFTELPVLLVALHVVGATLLTIAVARLVLAVESGVTEASAAEPVGIAPRGFAE